MRAALHPRLRVAHQTQPLRTTVLVPEPDPEPRPQPPLHTSAVLVAEVVLGLAVEKVAHDVAPAHAASALAG